MPFLFAFVFPLLAGFALGVLRALIAAPKPIFGSQLKNKAVSSSAYGLPWPRCRGDVRVNGNMIWSTKIRESNHLTKTGGISIFFPTPIHVGQQKIYTYTYSVSCAIGFGYKLGGGKAGSFLTLYADGKILYSAKVTDASLSGSVTLVGSGTTDFGGQTVTTAALGSQSITLATGAGASLKLSIGDLIQISYGTITINGNDIQSITWNSAPGLTGGTFGSLGLTLDMTQQEYEVQSPLVLGPNQTGVIGIYPSLIADYPAGGALVIPGLTTPLLDISSFDPDPHDGSHPSAGGYYAKKGTITFYYGSDTQNSDPTMVTALGPGNVPAYRGMVYCVIKDLELANYGNRIPNFSAEIRFEGTTGNSDASTVGQILGVQMTNYGIGYNVAPQVVFSGDGTGALGIAVMGNISHVLSVEMINNGSGYTNATVTFIANDGGVLAAGTPILSGGEPLAAATPPVVTLADIVGNIMTEAGYAASEYDVSALALTPIQGIELDQESYQQSLQRLMGLYLFDSAEIDGQIVFNFRDGLPLVEISEDDIGALADSSSQEPRIEEMLQDETSVPYFVWIRYYDPLKLYQQASQYAKRISQPFASTLLDKLPVVNSRDSLTLDVPITEQAGIMKQQAEKVLYDLWSSRMTVKFKLSYKYLQLDPTDIIEVPYKGDFLVVRLTQVNRGASLALELEGVSHDYHHSIALSDPGKGSGGTSKLPPGNVRPSVLFLLDVPFLDDRDAHNLEDTGLYFALGTTFDPNPNINRLGLNWHGGKLYRSVDQLIPDFASVGGSTTAAFNGTATTLLPAPINPVPANFSSDSLTVLWTGYDANTKTGPSLPLMSSTDDGVTGSHENLAALIKSNGEVELFQFVNATDNGDGTFTLSRIVRGVRGTETMAKGHAVGDTFVLLTGTAGLQGSQHFDIPLGDRNLNRYYAAISDGATSDFSSPTPDATVCRDLMPYAPYQITQQVDPFGNLIISWTRRSRIGGTWADGTGGPLSEQYEEYEVDILGPGNVILRTKATPLPTLIYTNAEQVADFGAAVATVGVMVYQISAIVGRGFPGTIAAASTPTWGGEPYALTYDMGPLISPTAGETMHEHIIPGNVTGVIFPIGLDESTAGCRVAPSTNYVIAINWKPDPTSAGTQVATLTYSPGSTLGRFALGSFVSGYNFSVLSGQVVEFVAPATIDLTISGIYFTLSGKRYTGSPATVGVKLP